MITIKRIIMILVLIASWGCFFALGQTTQPLMPASTASQPTSQGVASNQTAQPQQTQNSGSQAQLNSQSTIPTPSENKMQIAPPADIASLNAKEILSANNAVVSHIAEMYQYFGLFITIIVTIGATVATVLSYFAKKNVNDLVEEWKKKMQSIEIDMKSSLERLHDAVKKAEESATKAEKYAHDYEDGTKIISKTLIDVDTLRTAVSSLKNQINAEGLRGEIPQALRDESIDYMSLGDSAVIAEEDKQVSEKLKGKIVQPDSEGENNE